MSADNGIYILQTPNGMGGLEYRVRDLQAIDNLYWIESGPSDNPKDWITNAREYWMDCEIFCSVVDAYNHALQMEIQMQEEDGFSTEYGICMIHIDEIFSPVDPDAHRGEGI